MSDPNKPENPDAETAKAVPGIVQDATTSKIIVDTGPKLPALQTVSLGSGRVDIQKVISADTSSPNKPTDIPKMTETDAIGTPLELERTLEELRKVFGGSPVIETEAIISDKEGKIRIKIEFGSNGTTISWQDTKGNKSGEQKFFVYPLKSDDSTSKIFDNHFLQLGVIRAILRNRLEKLSKSEE